MSVSSRPDIADTPEFVRFKTLYHLLVALSKANALEDVFEAALTSLLDATAADRAAILLIDDDGVMRFQASLGLSSRYQAAVTGHSPWQRGQRNVQPIVVPDVSRDESLAAYREILAEEGIRALAFIPLALDAGVFGKFMLYYSVLHEVTNDELEIAQAIAAHVALAAERKRAEMARARIEQRMQAILDNSAAIISLKDLQGRYLLVNRRHEELFHIPKDKLLGRTDYDLFPAETAKQFTANDRDALTAGKAMAVEEQVAQEDGIHTYVAMKFPVEDLNGVVAGLCGIATDITDRKKLENAGRHLAAIVESSDDAIISKDLNGLITSWNQAATRLFGYTAEEVLGKPVSILAASEHRDEMPAILSKIRNGQRVEHFETRRRRKNGEIIDVSLTVSPVRDEAGRVVGASKIARDITQRKLAEQERISLLAREREARRTAELLNRVAPRLAAQLDLEKLVQAVTDIAAALVGADFGAFVHNIVNEKGESYMVHTLSRGVDETVAGFTMPPDAEFLAMFRGAGMVRSDDLTEDSAYRQNPSHYCIPAGEPTVRSYLALPVISRSRELLGGLFVGHAEPGKFSVMHEEILTGIAAQAAIAMDNARLFEQAEWVQSELKRSNEELRRLNRDLEVFAYSASHDLQEPLRNIAISAQIVERRWGTRLEGEDAVLIAEIMKSARRMSSLIEDLLAYTQATKSAAGTAPQVDPAAVLSGVLEDLRAPIGESGALVTWADLPAVAIHEARLAQLFQNLIGNAIKYRSKEVPRVQITAEQKDGWIVFSITDNGIGIEPQYAEQIFGLFKRLHGRTEYPGSGIGLAICQRLVEQYGGRIWLEESAPGKGSTFRFSIPARP